MPGDCEDERDIYKTLVKKFRSLFKSVKVPSGLHKVATLQWVVSIILALTKRNLDIVYTANIIFFKTS